MARDRQPMISYLYLIVSYLVFETLLIWHYY